REREAGHRELVLAAAGHGTWGLSRARVQPRRRKRTSKLGSPSEVDREAPTTAQAPSSPASRRSRARAGHLLSKGLAGARSIAQAGVRPAPSPRRSEVRQTRCPARRAPCDRCVGGSFRKPPTHRKSWAAHLARARAPRAST